MSYIKTTIAGVILAGGQGRRMQVQATANALNPPGSESIASSKRHKWQQHLGTNSLLTHALTRLKPQVDTLVISGPEHPELLATGYPVLADTLPNYAGPLAGLYSAMTWARDNGYPWLLSCPCDSPFLPEDLAALLSEAAQAAKAPIALAHSHGKSHPVFGLWSVELWEELNRTLSTTDERAIGRWARKHHAASAHFSSSLTGIDGELIDPFFNINTPEDLAIAKTLINPIAE